MSDEIETSADIAAMYDDWVDDGAYERDVAGWGYDLPERAAALVAEHVTAMPPSRMPVLDVGCDTGLVGDALDGAVANGVVGVDVSLQSLVRARRRSVYRALALVDLDAELPFEAASVAAAVSVGVLEYLADPALTIAELVRIVAPGGAVVVTHRSDMWDSDGFDDIVATYRRSGTCAVSVERLGAYLPGHEDFGDEIESVIALLEKEASRTR